MTDAVIVSTARTGLAKSWRGALNMTHGATLGGHVVRHAMERARVDPAQVEDVLMGCAYPEGATGANIARQIALRAGCPVTVPGATVNRFCSSGLQTIAMAAQRVIAGEGEVFVAGGVESISCVQNESNRHMIRESWLTEHKPELYWTDAADRGERLEALRHRARQAGRVRRAQPATRRRRGRRGQVQRRDRADHGARRARRQGRGTPLHEGSHARQRRRHPRRHDVRRRREDPPRASRRRDRRGQREPVLRRRFGLRGDERARGGEVGC